MFVCPLLHHNHSYEFWGIATAHTLSYARARERMRNSIRSGNGSMPRMVKAVAIKCACPKDRVIDLS